MARPTGNSRSDAKNKLGLTGISPVDPAGAEALPRDQQARGSRHMSILTEPGSDVRATHPGTVSRVESSGPTKVVEIVANTQVNLKKPLTDPSGKLTPAGKLSEVIVKSSAFTRYSNLGTVNVVRGQTVPAGFLIGTVSQTPLTGERTGLKYQVFSNGSGNASAEQFPEGEHGIAVVKNSNPNFVAPDASEQLRKPPPAAPEESPALAPKDPIGTTKSVPTAGPKSPNVPYQGSKPQVNFAEQINQVFTHDYLVFISGVDVTKYITGTVSVNLVDRDGWSEATFSLNNSHDNFVITQDNLGLNAQGVSIFRAGAVGGEDRYSERAKKELFEYKNDETRNPFVDVKQQKTLRAGTTAGVLPSVNVTGFSLEEAGNEFGTLSKSARDELGQNSVGGKEVPLQLDRRWQLGYQSTILHKCDPVRIFRKNPLREADEWMPAFAGFIESPSYDTDYRTGKSNVKVSCVDVRGAFVRKKRVKTTATIALTNPRTIYLGPPGKNADSLFADLLSPSISPHPLANRSFESVMEFLITGASADDPSISKAFRESGTARGIGDFTVGEKIYFKPGDAATGEAPDSLEHWHALCLFGTDGKTRNQGDRIPSVISTTGKKVLGEELNRRWMTEAEARTIGAATTWDGDWAPHKMFVHFLLPALGTGARNLLDFDIVNVSTNNIEFRNVLDIMQDFANRIDYQFWVTPIGDIVIEFPQYDFVPADYGEYKNVFRVDRHLQSDVVQDEAGDIVTAVIAHGRLDGANEANKSVNDAVQKKAVVVAPLMMARYGVVEHELSLPFITSIDALRRLAMLEFQKKLAESNKMDMEFTYRPFITPNRPLENFPRQRMMLTTAVENRMDLHSTCGTTASGRYVRRALLQADRKTLGYTLMTGGLTMPVTYRQIYPTGTVGVVSGNQAATGTGIVEQIRFAGTNAPLSQPQGPGGTGLTTGVVVTPQSQPTIKAIEASADKAGFTPEMKGRFLALGQQMSGFAPTAANATTGGFGIFQMRSEVRGNNTGAGSLNIGNTTDKTKQIDGAATYFGGLVAKYKGDVGLAVEEFALGPKNLKNLKVLQAFRAGFGQINASLGKQYEQRAQTITTGFETQVPGQILPTDNSASASEATKNALAASLASDGIYAPGFQSSQGVLVFDTSVEQARSTKEFAAELQARQAAERKK